MKRIFSLLASAVLAASLLAMPCFAAAPDDAPLPGQSGPVQPDGSEPDGPELPGGTDGSGAQPCDACAPSKDQA